MFGFLAVMLVSQQSLDVRPIAQGTASYYTVASSSNLTASGERFRDNGMTCAMLNGEFGTYYLVVADNGRSVVVRLNDRGPFHPNRIIDLSKGAMRKLSSSKGLIKVKIYNLGKNIHSPNQRI